MYSLYLKKKKVTFPLRFGAGGVWPAASAGPASGRKGNRPAHCFALPRPRRPGGARWAAESRLRWRSHHAAFSRNFDVTHTWGKGLGEREEAAGEGAGGGGGGVAGTSRGTLLPRAPGRRARWDPPCAPARSRAATGSQAFPTLPPRPRIFHPGELIFSVWKPRAAASSAKS